jgi:DNA polymerase-3 subunit epsilon
MMLRSPASTVAAQYARAHVAVGKTPWRSAHFCVVDLELSGLDASRDEIISFAAVPIDSGRIAAGDALYGLCRPTRPLSEKSVLVHGIRTADLADAPTIDEALEPLIAAMTGRVMVAHVAWVERAFLGRALNRLGIRLREPVLDTHELGRLLAFKRGEQITSSSLSELTRSLGLPVHHPHHALGDALTTAQTFLAIATHLENFSPVTVRTLSSAGEHAWMYLR